MSRLKSIFFYGQNCLNLWMQPFIEKKNIALYVFGHFPYFYLKQERTCIGIQSRSLQD